MPVAVDMLNATLDRLADYESGDSVVSLYLDLKPEQPAQSYKAFLADAEKEFPDAASAFGEDPQHLETENPTSQALAVFSSNDEALFERSRSMFRSVVTVYIDHEPHVFPLERLADQFQSYAALLVNTNAARLYVLAVGAAGAPDYGEEQEREAGIGRRVVSSAVSAASGESSHETHERSGRGGRAAGARRAHCPYSRRRRRGGLPLLRESLSAATLELLTEIGGVDIKASEADVFRVTLEAFRDADQHTDQERVDAMLNAFRARGLATVGLAGVKGRSSAARWTAFWCPPLRPRALPTRPPPTST